MNAPSDNHHYDSVTSFTNWTVVWLSEGQVGVTTLTVTFLHVPCVTPA